MDALEKGMSPSRRWKNLEAPASGNQWISCVFLLFKAGYLGFSRILRWQLRIFSWNSRFYLGIASPGILASKYSRNPERALGTPRGLQGKQRKILEFAWNLPFPFPHSEVSVPFRCGRGNPGLSQSRCYSQNWE